MLHQLARATAPVALLLAISAAAPPIGAAAASPPLRAVAVASAVSYSAGLQGTDHSDSLSAIDCPAVGECTAVGSVKDAAGNSQATTIDQVDGTWGPATLQASAAVHEIDDSHEDGGVFWEPSAKVNVTTGPQTPSTSLTTAASAFPSLSEMTPAAVQVRTAVQEIAESSP